MTGVVHTSGLCVAVVGATGAVGIEMLDVIQKRKFPVRELRLFASPRSMGKVLPAGVCQVLDERSFEEVDIAFFDASDAVSREWVPRALQSGAMVVDNSGVYRMDPSVPLVVPEINGSEIESTPRMIAGPNCTTVQLVMALKPICDRWGLERVVVSTYQSMSGAGAAAIERLRGTRPDDLRCTPQVGSFGQGDLKDLTSEEIKICNETRKILKLPGLRIAATAVRVPTLYTHGESVHFELSRAAGLEEVSAALGSMPGVVVLSDPSEQVSARGRDEVFVSRLRRDPSAERGFQCWIVSDNLRKGAALNAIQIGELLARRVC